jgi:hypothetical protein
MATDSTSYALLFANLSFFREQNNTAHLLFYNIFEILNCYPIANLPAFSQEHQVRGSDNQRLFVEKDHLRHAKTFYKMLPWFSNAVKT